MSSAEIQHAQGSESRAGRTDWSTGVDLDRQARLAARLLSARGSSLVLRTAQGIDARGSYDSSGTTPVSASLRLRGEVMRLNLPVSFEDGQGWALLGAPIQSVRGEAVGAICVWDACPRGWSLDEIEALTDFAATLSFGVDSLDERRASHAAQERDELHASLIGALSEGIVVQEINTTILECNQSAQEILGLTREQILGRTSMDPRWRAIHPDGRAFPGEDHPSNVTLRTGKPCRDVPMGVLRPDGSLAWISVNSVPVTLPGEASPRYVVCSFADVTERFRMESILRESEERFRDLADSCPAFIWTLDASGTCEFVNQYALDFSGMANDRNAWRTWIELTHPDDLPSFHAAFRSAFTARRPITVAARFRNKASEYRWIEMTALPRFGSDGSFAGCVGSGVDVTDRIVAAQALRKALDAAVSAGEAKSRFLATMSHEFRTPMNSIIHMTEFALESNPGEPAAEYLREARTSSRLLLELIDGLLEFARLEADAVRASESVFHLPERVVEAARASGAAAERKGLRLSCLVESNIPETVKGDAHHLRQVLGRLIGNAIKFTETGEIVVRASVWGETEDHISVTFSVRDTGIGIPSNQIKRIFDPFYQVDNSPTRSQGGIGLGLSIASRLVELMGGSLSVETRAGVGSEFRFTLPLRRVDGSSPDATPRLGSMILLACDHLSGRRETELVLTRMRLPHGDLHEDSAEAHAECVFLIDADLSAHETARELRERFGSACRLILVVPLSTSDDHELALNLGVDAVLTRPLRSSDLKQALLKVGYPLEHETKAETRTTPVMASRGRIMLVGSSDLKHTLPYLNLFRQAGYETITAGSPEVVRTLLHSGSTFIASVLFLPDSLRVRDLLAESDRVARLVEVDRRVSPSAVLECLANKDLPTPPPPLPVEEPVFSWPRLLERFDGDTSLIAELSDVYRQEVAEQFDTLEQAVAAGRPSQVAEIAHAMRGATSNFEAPGIISMLSRIESNAKSRFLTPTPDELDQLKSLLSKLLTQLQKRLGG